MSFPILKVDSKNIWQTTNLDVDVCEDVMGWKWWAYKGSAGSNREGTYRECQVRQIFSPTMNKDAWKRWLDFGVTPADMTEPVDSRCGQIPHYSGHIEETFEMEKEIKRRKLVLEYIDALQNVVGTRINTPMQVFRLLQATPKQRCIAALVAVGSDKVKLIPPGEEKGGDGGD